MTETASMPATAADVRDAADEARTELLNAPGVGTAVAHAVVDEVLRSAYACSTLPQSASHDFAINQLSHFMVIDEDRDDIVASAVKEWEGLDPTMNAEFIARRLRLATRRARRVR